MNEKQPEITGHEGEAGSFHVVEGRRVPNADSPRTITPDDPEYKAARERVEAEAKAAIAPKGVVQPKGGK